MKYSTDTITDYSEFLLQNWYFSFSTRMDARKNLSLSLIYPVIYIFHILHTELVHFILFGIRFSTSRLLLNLFTPRALLRPRAGTNLYLYREAIFQLIGNNPETDKVMVLFGSDEQPLGMDRWSIAMIL